MPFGNVNVNYKPCKSAGQLKAAALYILGKKPEQVRNGTVKTAHDLYDALGCNRDNFANSILVTRKLNGKTYSKLKPNTILAHKLSISFHPEDNDKLTYREAYEIAREFAKKFMYDKGFEVLFAVHTDREHIHAHFLVSNCNFDTGKSYRRNQRDLYEMSEFFGEQCLKRGLVNSVRDNFYNHDLDNQRDRETFAEQQMKKRGAETFKDELREVIQIELADPNNKTFDDVIRGLSEHYNVECRVAGNTVSYRHPEYKDKNGKPVSVRGSRLGELYTKKGIMFAKEKLLQTRRYSAQNAEYSPQEERNDFNYELAKKSNIRTAAYGLDEAAAGLERFVSEGAVASGTGQTRGGGQIAGSAPSRNHGEDVQDFDRLYDRYRKRAAEDERQSAEHAEPARAVQKRNKGRSR